MKNAGELSDYSHPAVISRANEIVTGKETRLEKLRAIFQFVRDDIQFGFPPRWDQVKASETLAYGTGYCNTKATLFLALCKAAAIPAKIHCGFIDIRIMRGVLPSFVFRFMPEAGPHSWIDVEIDGSWKQIDSYINDQSFNRGALQRLKESDWDTGYSICLAKGESSNEFNFGEKGFLHMGAVIEDHGAWDDFSEYMASNKYTGMNRMQLASYPILAALGNRNVRGIRSHGIVQTLDISIPPRDAS